MIEMKDYAHCLEILTITNTMVEQYSHYGDGFWTDSLRSELKKLLKEFTTHSDKLTEAKWTELSGKFTTFVVNFRDMAGVSLLFDAYLFSLDAVKVLIKADLDPNAKNKSETPLLCQMIERKTTDINLLRVLLEAGADPNATSMSGNAVYSAIARTGDIHYASEVLKLLNEYKADMNFVHPSTGQNPLHSSFEQGPEYALLLLNYKIEVNVEDKFGRNPLSLALTHFVRNPDVTHSLLIGKLLEKGANPNHSSHFFIANKGNHTADETMTALAFADKYIVDERIIELLKNYAKNTVNNTQNPTEKTNTIETPIKVEDLPLCIQALKFLKSIEPNSLLSKANQIDKLLAKFEAKDPIPADQWTRITIDLESLIKGYQDKVNNSILFYYNEATPELLDFFFRLGLKPDSFTKSGTPYLNEGILLKADLKLVEAMLKGGARPNDADPNKESAIWAVLRTAHRYHNTENIISYAKELIQLLSSYKADLQARNIKLSTPLHLSLQQGQYALAEMLLNYKVEANVYDDHFRTPLSIVIGDHRGWKRERDMLELLLKSGANPAQKANFDFDLENRVTNPMQVKHRASIKNDLDTVFKPYENSCHSSYDPFKGMNDQHAHTPLHYAAFAHDVERTKALLTTEGVDYKDLDGKTALFYCISGVTFYKNEKLYAPDDNQARLEVAKLLIDAGASFKVKDSQGFTPEEYASENDDFLMLNFFELCEAKVKAQNGASARGNSFNAETAEAQTTCSGLLFKGFSNRGNQVTPTNEAGKAAYSPRKS